MRKRGLTVTPAVFCCVPSFVALRRYSENQRVLGAAMEKLGFKLYLKPEHQGYIISSYHYPKDKNWDFEKFYSK